MKDHFNRFAARFLTTLLLGLLALLLHPWAGNAVLGIFLPQYNAPWELSKLAYWPMLAALVLTGHLSGGVKRTLTEALPALTLTAPALFLIYWAVSSLEPAWGVYLILWAAMAALGTALSGKGRSGSIWLIMAAALGVLYIVFSLCPPGFGPFLDPHDVAAMATIPC